MTTPRVAQPRGGGRPWKITQQKVDRIVDLMRGGNFYTTAAQAAGVNYQTFIDWRRHGARLLDELHADPDYTDDLHDTITTAETARVEGTTERPRSAARIIMEAADRPPHEVLLVELVERLSIAEAEAEASAVLSIVAATRTDWKAAQAYLKLRHGDRWREHQVTEVTGAEGGPVSLSVSDPQVQAAMADPSARAAASALLAAIAPRGPSTPAPDDSDEILVVGDPDDGAGDLAESPGAALVAGPGPDGGGRPVEGHDGGG